MTSGDTETVTEPSGDKAWVVYNLSGRDVEFQRPSPEQMMVLRRLARQLDDPQVTISRQFILMAKILDAISACMVKEDDVEYADQLVLERKIGMEELTPMIVAVLRGEKDPAPTTGPVKKAPAKRVRRS